MKVVKEEEGRRRGRSEVDVWAGFVGEGKSP
jgi:hypothetical protein